MRTPLQRAADDVRAASRRLYDAGPLPPGPQVAPPEFSPPIYVEALAAPELRYQYERLRCYAMAGIFRRWLYSYVAWRGIPLDDVIEDCEWLGAMVEAVMLMRVQWPHLAPPDESDDADEPGGITVADAAEMGLTVAATPRARPRKRKGTLPGCATEGCAKLRRPGEQWCPACARKMVEKWRSEHR